MRTEDSDRISKSLMEMDHKHRTDRALYDEKDILLASLETDPESLKTATLLMGGICKAYHVLMGSGPYSIDTTDKWFEEHLASLRNVYARYAGGSPEATESPVGVPSPSKAI